MPFALLPPCAVFGARGLIRFVDSFALPVTDPTGSLGEGGEIIGGGYGYWYYFVYIPENTTSKETGDGQENSEEST